MKAMTSRQRLLAAMRREEVDRIPLAPRMTLHLIPRLYGSDAIWAVKKFKHDRFDCDPSVDWSFPAVNPFYNYAAPLTYLKNINASLHYQEQGDLYMVTRTFETPAGGLCEKIMVPKPGAGHYGASPNPHRVEHLIKSPEDVEKVRYLFPDLKNVNFTDYHHAVEEMGEDGVVQLNVPGPMDYWGGEAYAMENMMMDYYERPQFFDALLQIFAEHSINMVKVALEHDVRNFFLVYFYPSLSSGWSPKIIREKFAPVIKTQVDMIHSCGGLADYYDDGKLMDSLDIFVDTGIDVIETCSPAPVGDFRLAESKKRWGHRVTFKGVTDMINVMVRGTPEDIEKHVRDIISQNGDKKGLILGTMDNIRPETPDENVAAYFSAANKYR